LENRLFLVIFASMNSPIKYFGGKGTMFNNIIKFFPNREEYNTYIEPFGGSFSVGLKRDPVEIEIYNDLDRNVYSLYKVLSDPKLFEEFKRKCDLVFYNEDIRAEHKEKLKDEKLSIEDRAFSFFYVNRTSHNGIGGFSKNTYVRRSMSKSVSDFLSAIDRLPELHNRLSSVLVSNTDGIKLIRKFNRENVFMYCDPPYEQSTRTNTRYSVDMDRTGHLDFLDAVMESKAKILISGYDCELYDVLSENGFYKVSFDVKTISGNFKPKTKTEYLYYNYDVK
jgi:DNA adenine methylase